MKTRAEQVLQAMEEAETEKVRKDLMEVLISFGGKSKEQFGNVVISAGGAGSGKGFVLNNLVSIQGKTLDVDSFKDLAFKLPKLKRAVEKEIGKPIGDLKLKNQADVSTLHQALKATGISNAQKQALLTSVLAADPARLPNIIFDITAKSIEDLFKVTQAAYDMGYSKDKIHLVWTVTDIKAAAKANQSRKRTVSDDILTSTHNGVLATMKQLFQDGKTILRYLNGSVTFVFNRRSDTLLQKSNKGGSYISKTFYVTVKQQGKPATPINNLDATVMAKLKDVFPKGSFPK